MANFTIIPNVSQIDIVMREANFSESQLQQAVNTAYIRYVFEKNGTWVFANVPSLIDEFYLGWDSAFYFPWLPHHPLFDNEGCNFFIQYKLSGELTSAGAKEWGHWKKPFFRFKIPHSTKDSSGEFVDDYHQWNRLKDLADKGYPTFYATNSTLSKDNLRKASTGGTLLDEIPLLDVRCVTIPHKFVTFTTSSTFFMLHSEKEEASKLNFIGALEEFSEVEKISMDVSVDILIKSLLEMGDNDEMWIKDLSRIRESRDIDMPRTMKLWRVQLLLSYFVRKHVGAELLWFPKMANKANSADAKSSVAE